MCPGRLLMGFLGQAVLLSKRLEDDPVLHIYHHEMR